MNDVEITGMMGFLFLAGGTVLGHYYSVWGFPLTVVGIAMLCACGNMANEQPPCIKVEGK